MENVLLDNVSRLRLPHRWSPSAPECCTLLVAKMVESRPCNDLFLVAHKRDDWVHSGVMNLWITTRWLDRRYACSKSSDLPSRALPSAAFRPPVPHRCTRRALSRIPSPTLLSRDLCACLLKFARTIASATGAITAPRRPRRSIARSPAPTRVRACPRRCCVPLAAAS